MTKQVPVRLTDEDLTALDSAIAEGRFASRSEALRLGLASVLKEKRKRDIEDAYRRGYGEQPQEEWIGQAGLALFAAFSEAEGGEQL